MDWKLRAPCHPIKPNIHLYSIHRQSALCNLTNSFMYNAKLNSTILKDTILNGYDSVFHDHKNKRLQIENDKGKKNGGKKYQVAISAHCSLPA